MGLASNVAALVATFDLEVVRLLRDAMRTTAAVGALEVEGRRLAPAAIYERREPIRHAPVIEYRELNLIQAPAVPPHESHSTGKPVNTGACEASSPQPDVTPGNSPVEPPWKTLVWENKPAATPVKITIIRPDIIVSKGSILDVFI
jgi:hypothetical protein